MSENSGHRYCGNCGAEIRSGTSFCVSCGQQVERTEANGPSANMGSDFRGGSSFDQRNVRLLLLGMGALFSLVVSYLILSYSVTLGFLLIVLLALAVLVIRKNRGVQTRHEQRLFDTTNQYKESAWRAYEEGKHREIAQNAYEQFREYKEANNRKYEEANTSYQRWNQQKADEREHNERINPYTGQMFMDGRKFRVEDNVIYTRNNGATYNAVVLSVTPNEVEIEFVGNSLEMAGNLGLNSVIRVAPMKLRHPWLQNADAQDLRIERERAEQERRLERYREEDLRRQEEELRRQEELRRNFWRRQEERKQEERNRQKEPLWYQTAERLNMPWYQIAEFHNEEEEAKFVEREMRLRGEPPLLLNMGPDGDGGTKWEELWIPLELLRAVYGGKFDELPYEEEDGKRYWLREMVKPNVGLGFATTLRRIATDLEEPRQWLREKVKDGPTYISVQEIGNKASDWGNDNEYVANRIIESYHDKLWEGEFVPKDKHETQPAYEHYKGPYTVFYTGIWVERVY